MESLDFNNVLNIYKLKKLLKPDFILGKNIFEKQQ
ncbi:hypothetical protein FLSA109164_11700 [Flavobacterium saliperosum]